MYCTAHQQQFDFFFEICSEIIYAVTGTSSFQSMHVTYAYFADIIHSCYDRREPPNK